jgi:hypothetical protein
MLLLPIEGIRKGMEPCNKGRSPYNGRLSDFHVANEVQTLSDAFPFVVCICLV